VKRTTIKAYDEHTGDLLDIYTFDGTTDPTNSKPQRGEIWRTTVETIEPFTVGEAAYNFLFAGVLAGKTFLTALGRPAAQRIDRYVATLAEREQILRSTQVPDPTE
jgi:hypothetical protein